MPKSKKKAKQPQPKSQVAKIKQFYVKNRFATPLTAIAVVVVLAVSIAYGIQYFGQKNQLQWLDERFAVAQQEIDSKNLATSTKIDKVCLYPHRQSFFDNGALYCGAKMTGTISGTSAEEIGNKFAFIRAEIESRNALGSVERQENSPTQFSIPDRKKFECYDFTTTLHTKDDVATQAESFAISCYLPSVRQYYPMENQLLKEIE